jgi:hypothetical protein
LPNSPPPTRPCTSKSASEGEGTAPDAELPAESLQLHEVGVKLPGEGVLDINSRGTHAQLRVGLMLIVFRRAKDLVPFSAHTPTNHTPSKQ